MIMFCLLACPFNFIFKLNHVLLLNFTLFEGQQSTLQCMPQTAAVKCTLLVEMLNRLKPLTSINVVCSVDADDRSLKYFGELQTNVKF